MAYRFIETNCRYFHVYDPIDSEEDRYGENSPSIWVWLGAGGGFAPKLCNVHTGNIEFPLTSIYEVRLTEEWMYEC